MKKEDEFSLDEFDLENFEIEDFKFDKSEYDKQCKQQQLTNSEYLEIFENDMKKANLANSTIRRHRSNVDFYINTYLLREDSLKMSDGTFMIDMFLGYFFIRKCMWSTPGTIKTTAASIKKFYKCMAEHGYIENSSYNYLCNEIKENMESWQRECNEYNNGSEYFYIDE